MPDVDTIHRILTGQVAGNYLTVTFLRGGRLIETEVAPADTPPQMASSVECPIHPSIEALAYLLRVGQRAAPRGLPERICLMTQSVYGCVSIEGSAPQTGSPRPWLGAPWTQKEVLNHALGDGSIIASKPGQVPWCPHLWRDDTNSWHRPGEKGSGSVRQWEFRL